MATDQNTNKKQFPTQMWIDEAVEMNEATWKRLKQRFQPSNDRTHAHLLGMISPLAAAYPMIAADIHTQDSTTTFLANSPISTDRVAAIFTPMPGGQDTAGATENE